MTDYKNDGYILITKELQKVINDHDYLYDECDESECMLHSKLSNQHFDYELEIYIYRTDEFAAYVRALKDAYVSGGYASPEYDALLEELSRQGIKVPAYGTITCPADLRVESI